MLALFSVVMVSVEKSEIGETVKPSPEVIVVELQSAFAVKNSNKNTAHTYIRIYRFIILIYYRLQIYLSTFTLINKYPVNRGYTTKL